MKRFINCIAHKSSEGKLLIGTKHTALFDCGMAFCAEKTIENVKNALGGRPLDYIILTHTHYDHAGAMPFFREQWQQLKVLTSSLGAAVLLKDTPRRVFRELSAAAAKSLGGDTPCAPHSATYSDRAPHSAAPSLAEKCLSYSDDLLFADGTIGDGDTIDLGDLTIKVLETPGHTRDALSFFVPELQLLILSETSGVRLPDGRVLPCYLTSYKDTINSIEKCKKINYKYISLPHSGLLADGEADEFLEKSLIANTAYRNYILELREKGFDEDKIVESLCSEYCDETLLSIQPKESFLLNAHAATTTTLREQI